MLQRPLICLKDQRILISHVMSPLISITIIDNLTKLITQTTVHFTFLRTLSGHAKSIGEIN